MLDILSKFEPHFFSPLGEVEIKAQEVENVAAEKNDPQTVSVHI